MFHLTDSKIRIAEVLEVVSCGLLPDVLSKKDFFPTRQADTFI